MSIVAGQPVKASTDNAAFISKINGGDTVGIIGLKNSGSGGDIVNLQQYINKIALALGDMTEAGSNELDYTSVNYIADNMTHKQAIEALDAQLSITQGMVDDHETRLLNAEATIVNHENRIDSLETGNMTIAGNKTFSGSTVFSGDVEMTGTVTQINSVNTIIADPLLTLNNNGTNVTAEDAGFEVERPLGNGQVLFDSALDSKWKVGVVGSMYQVLVSGIAQTVSGIKDFVSGLKSDTISESTLNAGVTIDGVLVKDGLVDGRDVSTDGTDLDNHIGNSSIHFTEGSINHANITNIGTNTHAQIDSHIASTSNPHGVTAAQVGLTNVTDDAQLKRAAGDYNSFTLKATPVAADVVLIEDSADSFNKKKITLTDLIGGGGGSPGGADTQVQFNDGGAFGGAASMIWDKIKTIAAIGSGYSTLSSAFYTGQDFALTVFRNSVAGIKVITSGGVNDHASIWLQKSEGTTASPTATGSFDKIGAIFFGGHTGTSENESATIMVEQVAANASGNSPSKMIFKTTSTAGVRDNRLVINESGSLQTFSGVLELGNLQTAGADRSAFIDFHTQAGAPVDYNARIIKNSGANGLMEIVNGGTGDISLFAGGGSRFRIVQDGRLQAASIHNNAGGAGSGSTTPHIASGTYTPAIADTAFLTSAGAYVAQWMRVGNVVHVSGKLDLWASANGADTQLTLTLPINRATNFATGAYQAAGNCTPDVPDYASYFLVKAEVGTVNKVRFRGAIAVGGTYGYHYHYSYLIS